MTSCSLPLNRAILPMVLSESCLGRSEALVFHLFHAQLRARVTGRADCIGRYSGKSNSDPGKSPVLRGQVRCRYRHLKYWEADVISEVRARPMPVLTRIVWTRASQELPVKLERASLR